MHSDPKNEYPSLLVGLKILHLYCLKQCECEIYDIRTANLTRGANTKDAAQVERAANLRHAETITHEVDGVYAIRAKGRDAIH